MQFFHVSITIVALELATPAQIEKKWILPLSLTLLIPYCFPIKSPLKVV